ncbi:MAG: rhomboid family intramembrane serine protease [Candidatus Binataceae bacterium]
MIPLRDSAAPRRLTPVNSALIAANLAVFIYELMLGVSAIPFLARFAMVPVRVSAAVGAIAHPRAGMSFGAIAAPLATIFSSIFLHAGIWHIAGNMLYLFFFGAAVEYRMGPRRYLAFYFASGIAAAIAIVAIAPSSAIPVIGASGAIAGVLGAYFILYPRGRIQTLLPLRMFEVPAVIYLLVWFGVQLYGALAAGLHGASAGGVAWWAHVGGFLFGMLAGPMLARTHRRARRK